MDDLTVGVDPEGLDKKIADLAGCRGDISTYLLSRTQERQSKGPCAESLNRFDEAVYTRYAQQLCDVFDNTIKYLQYAKEDLEKL